MTFSCEFRTNKTCDKTRYRIGEMKIHVAGDSLPQ